MASVKVLLTVISIDQNRGVSDILNILGKDTTEEHFTEIGKVDDVTFYIMEEALPEERDAYLESLDPAYKEEYSVLHDALAEALTKAEFAIPVVPGADLVGRTIEFETVDVDGNPVNSRDLFKERQITMINVWATWCGPFKGAPAEMSAYEEKIDAFLAGKGN